MHRNPVQGTSLLALRSVVLGRDADDVVDGVATTGPPARARPMLASLGGHHGPTVAYDLVLQFNMLSAPAVRR
jgi:hypothetical protein